MTSYPPARTCRVVFTANGLTRGGAETQLIGVITAAVAQGHQVALAVMNPGNDYATQLAELGIPVWLPPADAGYWNLRYLLRLFAQIRRWRPEVTVAFLFQATLFMRVVNVVVRPRRSIASMRNDHLESRLRGWLYRRSCFLDDVVVTNSHSALTTLQGDGVLGRDPGRVAVIYNGIDVEQVRSLTVRDRNEVRAELGCQESEVLVVGVGRLAPQKDWSLLIDALARPGATNVRCAIAGEGDLRDALADLITRHDLDNRVRLLGLRSDVPDLMAAADCVVLSSRYEGTPNVVLEALALGVPVIATDVGACRELLIRSVDTLIPVGSVEALASALQEVRERDVASLDPTAEYLLASFGWPAIGGAWLRLIEN